MVSVMGGPLWSSADDRRATDMLRGLAVLLILNSHLDRFVAPDWMTVGGGLGNALFFLLSGYGLGCSDRAARLNFARWYFHRVRRILPAAWLGGTLVLLGAIGKGEHLTAAGLVSTLVFPTPFWFVAAILALYIPAYLLLRTSGCRYLACALAASVVAYAVWYTRLDTSKWVIESDGYFKWVFYGIVMLVGILLARGALRADRWGPSTVVLGAAGYILAKLGVAYLGFANHQWVVQAFALVLVVGVWILRAQLSGILESRVPHSDRWLRALGRVSLEVYVSQIVVLRTLGAPLQILGSQWAVIIFLGLSIATGVLLHVVIEWLVMDAPARLATARVDQRGTGPCDTGGNGG